jgi:histone deacetylase complex subunit SAP30
LRLAQISWNAQDRALLQGYRRTYRLDTPSSFKNPLSPAVLGSGIGKYSPTMARPKSKRRVPKDQLALAVRKNFNATGVSETEVLVHLLYKVKNNGTNRFWTATHMTADTVIDKEFRARFTPKR